MNQFMELFILMNCNLLFNALKMPLQFFEGMENQGSAITEFMHPSLMQIKKRERIIDKLYPGSQPHYIWRS